jgi:hypothetical protein
VKCSACQRDIADGSSFCPYCGNSQPAGSVSSTPSAVAPPASMPSPATPPVSAPASAPAWTPQGGLPPSNRGTIALVLGIGGIVFNLLACCCSGLPGAVSIGLGIGAFIVGRNELEDINGGLVDGAGKDMANIGRIIGIITAAIGALELMAGLAYLAFIVIAGATSH